MTPSALDPSSSDSTALAAGLSVVAATGPSLALLAESFSQQILALVAAALESGNVETLQEELEEAKTTFLAACTASAPPSSET